MCRVSHDNNRNICVCTKFKQNISVHLKPLMPFLSCTRNFYQSFPCFFFLLLPIYTLPHRCFIIYPIVLLLLLFRWIYILDIGNRAFPIMKVISLGQTLRRCNYQASGNDDFKSFKQILSNCFQKACIGLYFQK